MHATAAGGTISVAGLLPARVSGMERAVGVMAFVLLTALAAQVQVPLPGGVPMTLQTLSVVLAGLVLGPRWGSVSMLTYLLLGMAGVGVFADSSGGVRVVAGLTGGYLLGFLLAQPVIAGIGRLDRLSGLWRSLLGAAAGHAIVFGLGVPWLMWVSGMNAGEALFNGFVVFVPGTVVKVALAGAIGGRVQPWMGARGW